MLGEGWGVSFPADIKYLQTGTSRLLVKMHHGEIIGHERFPGPTQPVTEIFLGCCWEGTPCIQQKPWPCPVGLIRPSALTTIFALPARVRALEELCNWLGGRGVVPQQSPPASGPAHQAHDPDPHAPLRGKSLSSPPGSSSLERLLLARGRPPPQIPCSSHAGGAYRSALSGRLELGDTGPHRHERPEKKYK